MATFTQTLPIAPQAGVVFKKLLVAYDFSPYAAIAVEYALDLAERQKAEIILLHISPVPSPVNMSTKIDADQRAAREHILDYILARCSSLQIAARALSRRGAVGEELTRVIAELHPDVLFLGAYGNDRQDRKVLGSTAELLLRTLPCPMVLVGPKAIKRSSDPAEPEKIVCPIDFPEDVHERLSMIARFAKALRAHVQLVHAVDINHEQSRPHSATDTQFEFDRLAADLLHEGVVAESTLLYGGPEVVVAERAERTKANYIVFGMHKDGNFSSFFRKSLVARVIKIAPCAVLAFPQTPEGVTPALGDSSRLGSPSLPPLAAPSTPLVGPAINEVTNDRQMKEGLRTMRKPFFVYHASAEKVRPRCLEIVTR